MTVTAAHDPEKAPDQRTRILDVALTLMSERGAADTSMRRLAAACDLNVATLYHYFPSKADLLASVIAERRYFELLAEGAPDIDHSVPVEERLRALLVWLADSAAAEEALIRLIVGESLRHEAEAVDTVVELLGAMDAALGRWLEVGFAELGTAVDELARAIRVQLIGLLVQELAAPSGDRAAVHQRWADDLVSIVFS
jgi:AcrR family transcriptional regulator